MNRQQRDQFRGQSPAQIDNANFFPKSHNPATGETQLATRRLRNNPPGEYDYSTPDRWDDAYRWFWIIVTAGSSVGLTYIIVRAWLYLNTTIIPAVNTALGTQL